jgi:arylformamidase
LHQNSILIDALLAHTGAMTDYRARFDADVTFTNGGSLSATGFRIDLPSSDVAEAEIGRLFLASAGLLLSEHVQLRNVEIIQEPHRGTRGAAATSADAPRLVELSHVIRDGLVTYPGLPAPTITPHLTRAESRTRYAAGTEFALDVITMIGNTGTYLDAPWHRFADGVDLAGLPLDRFVDLPAVLVRIVGTATRAIDANLLASVDGLAGAAVLLHTGDAARFGTPEYATDATYLTRDGAEWLVAQGAALVGIDAINIDDASDGARPAHTLLLEAGIPIVEHLTGLDQLPPRGARFTAAPPRVAEFGTFPVRAFATVPQ